jgi:hypothetical protein
MSAPNIACVLADAVGPLLAGLTDAMGCKADVSWFSASDRCHAFWSVNLHDHDRCFSGNDIDSPSRALMKANAQRQEWEEQQTRGQKLLAQDAQVSA